MRVRVIEDDADVAYFLTTYLERSGWTVDSWTVGFDALLDESAWDDSTEVALIDLQLHAVTQGLDILRWLAENRPTVRRVVLSGVVDHASDEVEALADEVVRKPPDPRSLLVALAPHDGEDVHDAS